MAFAADEIRFVVVLGVSLIGSYQNQYLDELYMQIQ